MDPLHADQLPNSKEKDSEDLDKETHMTTGRRMNPMDQFVSVVLRWAGP